MNKILIFLSLVIIHGCLISPKELDELNADNDFYSPAQTIKCMQMQPPQRPTPINKKGETRESYDQNDFARNARPRPPSSRKRQRYPETPDLERQGELASFGFSLEWSNCSISDNEPTKSP